MLGSQMTVLAAVQGLGAFHLLTGPQPFFISYIALRPDWNLRDAGVYILFLLACALLVS